MPELPDADDVHEFLDTHIRELKYVALGLGLFGGFLVARDLHLASRFCHVAQIPPRFMKNHVTLQGTVASVSSKGALSVQHQPILTMPYTHWIHSTFYDSHHTGELTVELAGVEMSDKAVEWLTDSAKDQHVWFQLMFAKENSVFCSVSAKKNLLFKRNLNETLVKQGLASVLRDECTLPPHDEERDKLISRLSILETKARDKKLGMWADCLPETKGDNRSLVKRIGCWVIRNLKGFWRKKD